MLWCIGRSRLMIWKRPSNVTARFSVWSMSAACTTREQDGRLHHAFDVSAEMFDKACKLFHQLGIKIHEPVDYGPGGFFTGRQLFVLDSRGNRIELRGASWKKGMPRPTYEQIVNS